MYLYNINTPAELTLDVMNNRFTNGDEFNLIISYDDLELQYNIPNESSYKNFIQSKRNSVIHFKNLVLPCQGLKLQLLEKDLNLKNLDDASNIGTFDCQSLGIIEGAFHVGDDASRGRYRLVANQVVSSEDRPIESSFSQEFEVFSPVDTEFGDDSLDSFYRNSRSPKAMKFKSLINPFNTNDYMGTDQISISIFSDSVGKMFKCG